ncbi:MAG TPA: hypothetical protein VE090_06540 [Methylomirabilota bacterium]|nr:hypothetical protein [Methylomirabilota bacterium]
MKIIFELNKEQLTGLANLCFDIAKGAFITVFIPALLLKLKESVAE